MSKQRQTCCVSTFAAFSPRCPLSLLLLDKRDALARSLIGASGLRCGSAQAALLVSAPVGRVDSMSSRSR